MHCLIVLCAITESREPFEPAAAESTRLRRDGLLWSYCDSLSRKRDSGARGETIAGFRRLEFPAFHGHYSKGKTT